MSFKSLFATCVAVASICVLSLPSQAAVTVYSSQAAFSGATSGLTTITFEGITGNTSFASYGNNANIGGVNFHQTNGSGLFVIGQGYYGYTSTTAYLNADYGSPTTLVATLPTGVTSLGTEFGGLFQSEPFIITLSTGDTFAVTGNYINQGWSFIGFTSSTPITSITFEDIGTQGYLALDNFQFGSGSSAVPEPSTVAAFLIGFLGLSAVIVAKRRKINA